MAALGPDVDPVVMSEIQHYGREKLYHHIQQLALENRRKRGATQLMSFWNAFSMMMEGSVADAIREFQQLNHRDLILCTTLALIHAHKQSPTFDRETVQALDVKMREERKSCGEMGWYHAGMLWLMVGRHDKAREYVGRVLKASPTNPEACTLYGWIDLTCGRDSLVKKSVEYFDRALNNRETVPVPPECYLGKARFFEMRKELSGALDLVNLAVVDYPEYLPALEEKCRLQLVLQGWDQCYDTAQRILKRCPTSIAAHQYQALYSICKEGKPQEAAQKVGDLLEAIDRCEPHNHRLYYDMATVFSRVAGGNQYLLQQTNALVERARSIAPSVSDYVTELGNQAMMKAKNQPTREAMKLFREAMKLDESSVEALTGVIWCQLLDGDLDDAEHQLDFLTELQTSIGESPELFFLRALLAEKKSAPIDEIVQKLRDTEKVHSERVKKFTLGAKYFVANSPHFTLRLVKMLMMYASEDGSNLVKLLHACENLLAELTKKAPGLIEGLYLTAKLWIIKGDLSRAQTALTRCMKLDATYSPAILLNAELALKKGDVGLCKQHLEVGLSHNFEVRDAPQFHLLQAQACMAGGGKALDAENSLTTALGLRGVRKAGNTGLPTADRASIFLELVEVYKQSKRESDAMTLITEAIALFKDTSEALRITIAHADLLLSSDVDAALSMLRAFKPTDKYYINSREKMARIFLKQRRDKASYIKCFKDLTEAVDSAHTQDLLGDAYMTLKEPGNAVEAYQAALKKDPHNGQFASKAGKAMVRTHNYAKAITYYETALRVSKQTTLRYDLAELHLKLRQYDKVNKLVNAALDEEKGQDAESLKSKVKYLLLLATVAEKSDDQRALDTLERAKQEQTAVLRLSQNTESASIDGMVERQRAADICCRSALLFIKRQDNEAAVRLYQESLMFVENYEKALIALAELYLSMGNVDACQQHCVSLLHHDSQHEAGAMMLAEVQLRKLQYDAASFHFEQLLGRSTNNYAALARVVDLKRRLGKLNESMAFINAAEKKLGLTVAAGYHFCKGLYHRYASNATEALKCFNLARKDKEWGERALYEMIDICLFPDNETLGGEMLAAVENESVRAPNERLDSEAMALRTAEKLWNEWKPSSSDSKLRHTLMHGQILLKTKNRQNVEDAIALFMGMMQPAGQDTQALEYTPAIVGLISAYLMLKQIPRARSQMKRIAKKNWSFREADDLERGWLLTVDNNISTGHVEDANKGLSRVLQYNQSCSKAWEYKGYLQEKAANFSEAARHYENAWRFSNQSNPVIGYKLGYNYLKAQKFVDAVEVCNKVLESHPSYPRIRKDIMDKARASIRL